MSTSNVAICASLGENAVPKESVVHTDVEMAERNGRQLATDMKAAVREEADGGVALEVGEAYSDEKFIMGVEKHENKPREKHAQIGTPMGESSAPEKPATPSEERNLGPTERIFNEPTNCIEAPSDCSVDSLLGIDAAGVFSEAVLGPEQCVSLRAPFLDDRPPATEDRAQGVGLAESLVTIAQAKIGVSRLSTDHNSPLALAKASALDDETARILRVRDIDVVEQTGGDEVDEVAGLLLDQASADQEPFASARSSDSCMGSSTGVSMRSDITSEVAPASAQVDAPTSDVASKALLPEGDNVLNTAALASSFSGDSPPPVNTSAIISSSSLSNHIALERTSSYMPVRTMSTAPSSPLTQLSSELDDGDRTRESSTGYRAGTDANIPVEGHKGEVFPATRSHSRALSSSDEINQNGSDSSGGSGSSSDTTSSNFSSLPTLTPPPRQFLDCINLPPSCIPKELYCPMEEAYTDLAPRAFNSAEPAIDTPSPQASKNVITSDHPDPGDSGHDGQQEVTPDPISAPRGRKRRRRRHSRSRSPLHMYGEEEALALFGQNVTLYSVCGPPGGIPIGVGTLQCHPADGGRASFNLYIEDEMQHLLVETMKATVPNEPKASGSRSTRALNRFSKSQTAKRRGTKNKLKSRAKDTNEQDLANYSSCHACCRKTDYPKMKCSNLRPNGARCKFQFCDGCVERIFPEIQFDTQNLDFTCPRCAGTCLCMACKTSQSKMLAKLDENVKEDVVPTDTNADLVSAPGPSSKNGQSSLSRKALRKATATMQSTKLKRKADDDGYEEEASMSEAYPGKDDTITNSTVVDKTSHVPMAKNVSKRASGPQATDLMRDIAPKHDRKLCHQCRNRSTYAKMYCNVITESGETCKTTYCHRCISNRYPGFVFTVDGFFTCFKCSNSCNCDVCARRRGEEYIKSADLNKVMTENGRTSASSPISTLLTERARLKMPEAIAQCKPSAPQIDKEADEWFRSHRPELDTASNNGNSLRTRAFVGDWSPSWSPMRSCVEMESALVPTESASGESSSRLRPHLYIGKPITFQSSTVPLDTTCGMSSPLRSLSQSQKSQTKSLPSARSRSGRALKHSEKVRQYESGSEDDLPSSSARKRRRKIISSSAHDSASLSLSASKTSATERSSSHARLTSI